MEIDIPTSMKLVDKDDHDFCFQCGRKQKGFLKIKAAWDFDKCSDCGSYLE
jgi:hypothetical protein